MAPMDSASSHIYRLSTCNTGFNLHGDLEWEGGQRAIRESGDLHAANRGGTEAQPQDSALPACSRALPCARVPRNANGGAVVLLAVD